MKALSILQPWAWLIVAGHKPVENRRWFTHYRGPVLVHAGKKWGAEQRKDLLLIRQHFPHIKFPEAFDLGGIVGSVSLVDCVSDMDNPWFFGPYGFILENPVQLSFLPCRGSLGFFEPPPAAKTIWSAPPAGT